jgi:hypothetical protein
MANLIKYDLFSDAGFDDLFRGFFQSIRVERQSQAAASIGMDVTQATSPTSSTSKCPASTRTISRSRSRATG